MPGHWTAAGSRYWAINQPWKLLGWFEDPFQTELSFSSRYPPIYAGADMARRFG